MVSIMLKRSLLFVTISMVLTACSVFSPVKTECINEYVVNTVPYVSQSHRAVATTLAVAVPTASTIYQTKEMAYSTRLHTVDYFSKNRWAETPAQMLQPLMIQSLQNTHHYKAVAPSKGFGRFDLMLNTQVLQFQQDFSERSSVFKLTVRAQIVRVSKGTIVASKEFVIVEPAPQRNPYGGVIAANRATAKMLDQLSQWCVKYY